MSLLYNYFSPRKPVYNKNYRYVHHTVDRFVNAISRRFSYSPLLNRDCGSLVEVRSAKAKALLRNNMALSLEGHFNLRNMHLGVSPGRGGASQHSGVILACLGVH